MQTSGDQTDRMKKQSRSRRTRSSAEQGDLFGDRVLVPASPSGPVAAPDLNGYDNQEIIALVPRANLSNVEGLCGQVLQRGLGDAAVPALETLWHRFHGYGRDGALPEQHFSLQTLARIETQSARSAVTRIVCSPGLPRALLPLALDAALTARLILPHRQISPWLEHDMSLVRQRAFALARYCNPPGDLLERGRSDPDPAVRRNTHITMGMLGYGSVKQPLLTELERNPTGDVVQALAAIADADIIVRLGRCAEANPRLTTLIVEELIDTEDPMARKIARRLVAGS